MATPAFTRDDPDEWDDGWSRVPHGLWTLNVPPGARIMLGWLHSHTAPFLAKLSMNSCRKTMGSSQTTAWFTALEEAGYVKVERLANGRAATITLLTGPWRQLLGNRADIGAPTAPTSARIEEQGEDHPSSLRSEDDLQSQVRAVNGTANTVASEYWEWHVAEHGAQPTIKFLALRAVAKRLLISGHSADDIVDAMKTARAWTAKALAAEISRKAHERDQKPTSIAIPHALVKAFAAAQPFFNDKPGMHHEPPAPDVRGQVMAKCAAAMTNHGLDVGETMIRLAIVLRDVERQSWTTDELYLRILRADVPRFPGALADYPDAMQRAYTNRYWRAT